jgi:hypothetical protein
MRLVLIIVLLMITANGVSAQKLPEWYRVYTYDESTIEMNTALVTMISEDVTRVRFRWTFNEPQLLRGDSGKKYQSELQVMEFNCSAKQYRPYHLTFLDAAGDIVRIDDAPGKWQKVNFSNMIEKLFVPACDLIRTKTRGKSPVGAVQLEKVELEKVTRFAYDFAQHLEKAEDFKTLIDRFFTTNYLDGYLQDSRTNWFLNLNRDTAAKLSRQELQRFYVAQMNAGYLSSLYLISQLPSHAHGEDPAPIEKLLPPDVLNLIRTHAYTAQYKVRDDNYDFLGENVDSVERLRTYTDLLEKIGSLMRQHVNRVKSAQSRQWQRMLRHWDLYDPTIRVCADNCFGLPKGTRLFEVNVPVFRLQVAEVSGNLKVVSAISRF